MRLSDVIYEIEKLQVKYNKKRGPDCEFRYCEEDAKIDALVELKEILLDKGASEVEVKLTEKELEEMIYNEK